MCESKKWLVLWHRNGRLGSVELTAANLAAFTAEFNLSLLQRDATGTEHWEVLGYKRRRRSR